MTLTKAQLIDSIYRQVDLPKTRSAQVVESLLEIIKKTKTKGNGEGGTLRVVKI